MPPTGYRWRVMESGLVGLNLTRSEMLPLPAVLGDKPSSIAWGNMAPVAQEPLGRTQVHRFVVAVAPAVESGGEVALALGLFGPGAKIPHERVEVLATVVSACLVGHSAVPSAGGRPVAVCAVTSADGADAGRPSLVGCHGGCADQRWLEDNPATEVKPWGGPPARPAPLPAPPVPSATTALFGAAIGLAVGVRRPQDRTIMRAKKP